MAWLFVNILGASLPGIFGVMLYGYLVYWYRFLFCKLFCLFTGMFKQYYVTYKLKWRNAFNKCITCMLQQKHITGQIDQCIKQPIHITCHQINAFSYQCHQITAFSNQYTSQIIRSMHSATNVQYMWSNYCIQQPR